MLNRCEFIGNLGADPEVKTFQNGGKIANLRLAVTKKWKDREGQQKDVTEWVSIVVNGDGLVGVVERFLRKGSKVYVAGEMRTRKYSDSAGNDRYTTEVVIAGMGGQLVMIDGPKGDGGGRSQGGGSGGSSWGNGPSGNDWGSGGGASANDLDDDIAF